jgi:hypothetical protein
LDPEELRGVGLALGADEDVALMLGVVTTRSSTHNAGGAESSHDCIFAPRAPAAGTPSPAWLFGGGERTCISRDRNLIPTSRAI